MKSVFHPVISVQELSRKKRHAAWQGQAEVIVVYTAGNVRAYSGMCPHQGGPLGEGELTDRTITCPWHGCTFDLEAGNCIDLGACKNLTGMKLVPLPFEIRDGVVHVEIQEKS